MCYEMISFRNENGKTYIDPGRKGLAAKTTAIPVWMFHWDEGILFFQKKISYQHNMVAQVFIHHIKLFYFKMLIGKDIIDA